MDLINEQHINLTKTHTMNTEELLKTTPEGLAHKQHEALTQEAIKKLEEVIQCLRNKQYKELSEMLGFSAAGDGYGNDNEFIYFGGVTGLDDIGMVTEKLSKLAEQADINHTPYLSV